MFCKNCGNEFKNESQFCGGCGTAVLAYSKKSMVKGQYVKNLFRGRIGRLNFFLGHLITLLPLFVVVVFWGIVGIVSNTFEVSGSSGISTFHSVLNLIMPLLITLIVIGYIVFHLSLTVRRCHDIGISGWYVLLTAIPYLGVIPALYFLFKKGDEVLNKYGPTRNKDRKFISDILNY